MTTNIFTKYDRNGTAVAFLRITLGILFAVAAWPKLSTLGGEPDWAQRMLGFINFQQKTAAWWKAFLDGVVIPNSDFFACLTAYGEAAIAIALIFGAVTRPAIVFAVLYALSMMLTKGTPFWSPSSNDTLYILALTSLFFMKPGMTLGVDKFLKAKFPKLPV